MSQCCDPGKDYTVGKDLVTGIKPEKLQNGAPELFEASVMMWLVQSIPRHVKA